MPTPNKCTSIQAFAAPPSRGIMTGAARTTANGASMDVHYAANSGFSYYFETAKCWAFLPFSGGTASGGCRGQYLTPSEQGQFDQVVTWRFCDEDIPD